MANRSRTLFWTLAELPSEQMPLGRWLALHPASLVMQADSSVLGSYAKNFDYETGKSRKALAGTDTLSWRDKSWVIGIALGGASKAFDWNRLKRERVINDVVGGNPVVVMLSPDTTTYFAFLRASVGTRYSVRGDSLIAATGAAYSLGGRSATDSLTPVRASQEFWHSWRQFHPATEKY